ncbi:glycerol-3-phosphate dehydrogenase/oxidase [Deinococcus maricopensis]|uniref:Glycerol-3-phosphate dehydrogenase n=1 Tax=Deinococcus maricopensis (strain DSM 21211 / LMG 22137 / NRRL B-23946 / LB-34) TaxID=709986 RepID=E8U3R4_DEIML|nr:glycerol-3-phosphate dehydrogenase/oxidase [Deinococcus maricopensis]ADV68757.1 Glycerol-3-phosphate dehydrogenase [Deinococcus maricopensis DSM 21211]
MLDRDARFSALRGQTFDLLIVGGGITGAGLLREATRAGLHAALVEARDYAWGSSSRSSKMVHGGLRYLQHAQFRVTLDSVRERERLLREAPGLIEPLGFLMAVYDDHPERRPLYAAGLTLYDLLARRRSHQYHAAPDFALLAPHLRRAGLTGGFRYADAATDDARLVLRVLRDATRDGALALNYAPVTKLHLNRGEVRGASVRDAETGDEHLVRARIVINATGAHTDALRGELGCPPALRPLRGSHLVFPQTRFPASQAIAFQHPLDGRNVFVSPWQGHVLVGTTDLDHLTALTDDPRITPQETSYLMAGVTHAFPTLGLTLRDATAAWAGVRPVIGHGHADPSREARDTLIREERGLLSVTGGKLTTFRATAHAALRVATRRLGLPLHLPDTPFFDPVDEAALPGTLSVAQRRRLAGTYGPDAVELLRGAQPGDLHPMPGTHTLWAEVRHAARHEDVRGLSDLLLRRARVGFTLGTSSLALLPRVRDVTRDALGWSSERWNAEERAYEALIRAAYSVPDENDVPDWRLALARAQHARA